MKTPSHTTKHPMKPIQYALITLLLGITGCQTGQSGKMAAIDNGSFMGLWNTYSHCQAASNLEELNQDATTLADAANRSLGRESFVLPLPSKLEQLVSTPAARLAVDVKAMAAACSLRTGLAAVEAGKLDVAKDVLQALLNHHPQSDYIYYTAQAKALLSDLETKEVQVSLRLP